MGNNYNYEEEFFQAYKNTIELLKHNQEKPLLDNSSYFTSNYDEFLLKLGSILAYLGKTKDSNLPLYQPIANSAISNCGAFHLYFKPIVEKILNCNSYLTIGYIHLTEGRTFHKINAEDIHKAINTKIFPKSHHVWLTLDSGEIVDLTFGISYIAVNDKRQLDNMLKNKEIPILPTAIHPNNLLQGMQYHPIVIGEEILDYAGYRIQNQIELLHQYLSTGNIPNTLTN